MFTAGRRNPRTGGKTPKQPSEWLWPKFGVWETFGTCGGLFSIACRNDAMQYQYKAEPKDAPEELLPQFAMARCLTETHFQQRSDQETVVVPTATETEVPGSY